MRIAIIDDDRLVCDSLGIILGAQEDIEVVGCGCNGDDAVRLAREAAPDVLLMDIQMPGRDGLSAAREILGEGGRTRVVFLTTFSDDEYIVGALRLGATGYLIKQDVAAIAPALREVMAGRRVLEGRAMEDVNFSGGDDVAARPSRPRGLCVPHRARVRGGRAHSPGPGQQGDCGGRLHGRGHGPQPHQLHPGQARPAQPNPDRHSLPARVGCPFSSRP